MLTKPDFVRYFVNVALAAAFSVTAMVGPAQSGAADRLTQNLSNTITVDNVSGTSQKTYPLQFGRPFVQGEIQGYPQVLVNGTPILTQADVKNRYADGSVKFAI